MVSQQEHRVGALVDARFNASTTHVRVDLTRWYSGVVAARHSDGTYHIKYECAALITPTSPSPTPYPLTPNPYPLPPTPYPLTPNP